MKQPRLFFLVALALIMLAPQVRANGFVGAYAPANWTNTGMAGGTAGVDLAASTANSLVMSYAVNLGGGGVSQRTTTFSITAPTTELVSFDWNYNAFHAWFAANAELTFFAFDSNDVRQDNLVFSQSIGGGANPTGQISNMQVYAGKSWGLIVGGSNFDSNSILNGTVTLTNFVNDNVDCAGVPGGSSVFDNCGTCDTNPSNDCPADCAGAWGGTATIDSCGTCDDIVANDCIEDCNGTWGGTAQFDQCGTCDNDASNDCIEDCNGDWGGTAAIDLCGTCDDDANNDCTEDCNGDLGGTATLDQCGTCDESTANDCVQDCIGVWGGSAAIDKCGLCSGGTTGLNVNTCINDDPKDLGCGCGIVDQRSGLGPLVMLLLVSLLGIRQRN